VRLGTWIAIIIVVLLAGGGIYGVKHYDRATHAATAPSDIIITKVVPADITASVAANGTVVSLLDVPIKCRAGGEVINTPPDVSIQVKKGNLLLELDPSDMQPPRDQAKVAVALSQARLDEAKLNAQIADENLVTSRLRAHAAVEAAQTKCDNLVKKSARMKTLNQQHLASDEDLESAQTDAAAAANDLAVAKANLKDLDAQELNVQLKYKDVTLAENDLQSNILALKIADQNLSYCKVYSPIDGVVSVQSTARGTIIASAISNVGGGTQVMTISDFSRVFVLAAVDESDIGAVQPGQKVSMTADAYPGEIFDGVVQLIPPQGYLLQNVVTFNVKIEVTSENKKLLRSQMTTNVKIIEAEKKQVLSVPYQAINRKGDKAFVTVVNDGGGNEEHQVKLGITDYTTQEILAGLSVGQSVLVHTNDTASKWNSTRNAGGPPH